MSKRRTHDVQTKTRFFFGSTLKGCHEPLPSLAHFGKAENVSDILQHSGWAASVRHTFRWKRAWVDGVSPAVTCVILSSTSLWKEGSSNCCKSSRSFVLNCKAFFSFNLRSSLPNKCVITVDKRNKVLLSSSTSMSNTVARMLQRYLFNTCINRFHVLALFLFTRPIKQFFGRFVNSSSLQRFFFFHPQIGISSLLFPWPETSTSILQQTFRGSA